MRGESLRGQQEEPLRRRPEEEPLRCREPLRCEESLRGEKSVRGQESLCCEEPVRGQEMRLAVGILGAGLLAGPAAAQPKVIELTQVPCQFLESEAGRDRGFKSAKSADCEAINARTGKQRLAEARTIELAPGKYVFRVANKNVPYELGFWLRGESLIDRARLPSVSGGGLVTGKTQDYEIELKPGNYVYSCPLNPTPDYKLIVK